MCVFCICSSHLHLKVFFYLKNATVITLPEKIRFIQVYQICCLFFGCERAIGHQTRNVSSQLCTGERTTALSQMDSGALAWANAWLGWGDCIRAGERKTVVYRDMTLHRTCSVSHYSMWCFLTARLLLSAIRRLISQSVAGGRACQDEQRKLNNVISLRSNMSSNGNLRHEWKVCVGVCPASPGWVSSL